MALVTAISGVCKAGVTDEDRQHEYREAEDERINNHGNSPGPPSCAASRREGVQRTFLLLLTKRSAFCSFLKKRTKKLSPMIRLRL
jgi:hypothetical protein